uniref:ER membrane protein complex subunit 10 n=1 Tax=Schistosoma haematobium TaxID=6185 RepID=A0A094ZK61_SCHHA
MDGTSIKSSSGVLTLVSGGHVFSTDEKQQLQCQIIASRMRLKLTVSVNDAGDPIAIHMSTPKYDCSYDISESFMNLPDLSISLALQKPKLGPSPETAKYLEKLEKQREEMARAEQSDNRSFFAKYWTYIIPAVFLFILFSSMQDPNAAGGNIGGGNQQ